MKAVTLRSHGGPEVLRFEELPEPEAGPGEVRVAIGAVALNHVDVWVRKGLPHLKLEYLRSREEQFTLTPQADGTTLLTGTSYYESRLWPGDYWQLWTDMVAHQVHRVVLREIKTQSEGN